MLFCMCIKKMLKYIHDIFCCILLFTFLQLVCEGRRHHKKNNIDQPHLFLNEFVVEINGDNAAATAIAQKHGFINLGQVGELEGWYTFIDHRIRKRSLEHQDRTQRKLQRLKHDVVFVERLKVLSRPKRDGVLSLDYTSPNDPSWNDMWYMSCSTVSRPDCPSSMRITDAWRANYHGEGVVITILDDGIEYSHPDLSSNYDANASRDINDNDSDPAPRYDPTNENKHGTRCAGVVAAALNNSICGVGIAYRARIGGIRMLDGDVTDKVEATSLMYASNRIDIYSASWGPDDDGMTVEGPGALAKRAFETGVQKGRGGKGSIFIWASGNGGHNSDSCSCDGYINSIYTIGISSISQNGFRPWYLESCASTLASTYSSGELNEGKVVTTDLHRSCTHSHTGTSASAPMAAGVVALMLQANPELNWRDVQHIIVRTSNSEGFRAHDWIVNGAGFNVSHVFGFGLLDAAAATHVAKRWIEVPEQRSCPTEPQRIAAKITPSRDAILHMDVRACHGKENEIGYLEHVVLRITLLHHRRGYLDIFLTSPHGTVSNILEKREYDRSKQGFINWEFMTTHHWGENPMGVWTLQVRDNKSRFLRDTSRRGGLLQKWELIFYGTLENPQPGFHYNNCDAFPQEHCHHECNGCCGASAWECRSCKHVSTHDGQCVSACNSNQFVHEPDLICKNCFENCRTCNDASPNSCTSCFHGYAIENGACVKICDQGFYLEPSTQICRRCDDICGTCQNRSSICTSCRNSYIFESNTCRPSCDDGFYFASLLTGCLPCDESCLTCHRASTKCRTCASGYVKHRQRCVTSCPKKHFHDVETNQCMPCHISCKECAGPEINNCTRCQTDLELENGVCQKRCVDGQMGNFLQSHCVYVKKLNLCGVEFFYQICCHTCSTITEEEDWDFYDSLETSSGEEETQEENNEELSGGTRIIETTSYSSEAFQTTA